MGRYILHRIILMIPLLFGITVLTFLVMHLTPGKPTVVETDLNLRVSPADTERLLKIYGLDKPWYIQYGRWVKRILRLDFGSSFKDGRPVGRKIRERLPATLLLNVCSLLFIFLVAVPLGIITAVKVNSRFDRLVTVLVFIGFSLPTFWVALLLVIFFGLKLGWLPISGLHSWNYLEISSWERIWDTAGHLILPVLASGITGLAALSRYTRAEMLEVLHQDYVRTARAKGLAESRIIFRHAFRNALLPIITLIGLSLPDLIGGSFIFETIFAYPGMGRLGYEAIMSRDYPLVMGIGAVAAFLTLLGNLLADVLYGWADPRIRYQH